MDEKLKKDLNNVLKNNKNWPLIIEGGVSTSDFLSATLLPASTPSASLGVINDINGPVLPEWVKKIEEKEQDKTNLLVITDLDTIDMEEQYKFKGLLESKVLNGYPLPKNLQIVILINKGNRDKINRAIISLSLYYKAE